jgi:hypothetical protein
MFRLENDAARCHHSEPSKDEDDSSGTPKGALPVYSVGDGAHPANLSSLAALGFGWAHPHKVSGMENAFGAFNSESLPCVGSVRTREVVEVGNA